MSQQNGRTATLSMLVGKQVKLHLFLKEMSGRDLANRLGVSPSWVSYRLSGKQEIGIDDLFAIAQVLDVDLTELITPDVITKAKEAEGKGANQDFEQAPVEQIVTIGQGFAPPPIRVTPPPTPKRSPRPNGQVKVDTTRPVSGVPARDRRPRRIGTTTRSAAR